MIRLTRLLSIVILLLSANLFGNDQSYTLKKGDTLFSLSRRFGVPLELLQSYNGIEDPSSLKTGMNIRIPPHYVVRKGDTLYSISRRYGVDLDLLMRINGISDSTRLSVGMKLFLPQAAGEIADAPLPDQPSNPVEESTHSASLGVGPGSTDGLFWPHPGERRSINGKIRGILIQGRAGDKIVSVSSGRVVWVGPYRGFGRVVFVESENRYIYVYAGNEETLVKVGDYVTRGTEIGRLGLDAHQGVPQLLFLVYHRGKPVNPYQAPRS